MTESTNLPTAEEAREFLALVNAGRAADGLMPLEVLDFDLAEPGSVTNCLSARNLYVPVDECAVILKRSATGPTHVMKAIGADLESGHLWSIPAAILRVTNPFDARTPGLRDRLAEAGVVAP